MRITPLDIIQKQFSASKKGVDTEEVTDFLDQARETLEDVLRENQDHKVALAERDREIERLRAAEAEIKETLLMARRISEDLQGTARRESDLVMGEARLEAQQIINQTHDEHRHLLKEVMRLRSLRHQLTSQVRAVVEAHSRLLDDCEDLAGETDGL
jgi:DivIVA domain-containing protein